MTDRLYHTDATLTTFDATVTAVSTDGRCVRLDRTAFYPTAGGQPHDLGCLGDLAVVDVVDDDEGITHHLATPCPWTPGTMVHGQVEWTRRFDHMQQHTGQHLLSALFADRFGWATVSVHFGAEASTLDLATPAISDAQLQRAERDANELAVAALPVTVSFEDAATASGLRKPSDRDGVLRIITIEGLDRSACGGTHVAHTGQVGAILLRDAERTKGMTRVTFLCGHRVVTAARADHALLHRVAAPLSAAPRELPALVEMQAQRLKALDAELRRLRQALAVHDARAHHAAAAPGPDGIRRIRLHAATGPVRDLEPLAQAIAARGRAIVVGTSASPAAVLLATSEDSGLDAGRLLRTAVTATGGRGGGSARMAQGAVADAAALVEVAAGLLAQTAPGPAA
jgi:alanyl-tRNA synthetase